MMRKFQIKINLVATVLCVQFFLLNTADQYEYKYK